MIKLGDTTAYDVKEIAQAFNLSTATVRKYIKAGKLKGAKFGKSYYITEQSIKEYLDTIQQPAKQ